MFDSEAINDRQAQLPAASALLRKLHIDGWLLLMLLLGCSMGLLVLYSASGENWAVMKSQIIRMVLALVVMLALAQVPPTVYRLWAPGLFVAGLIMLIAVLLFGDKGGGAQRWLDLGIIRFQPSEMMKLCVPMMVAAYLHDKPLPPTMKTTAVASLIIAVPLALIARQPDLGTALLVSSAGVFAIFLAGLRWRIIIGLLILIASAAPVIWTVLLKAYQQQRILTLLNPNSDPLGSGYHIIQSQIAIGSGGLFGKGWTGGTQSHLEFLPEPHTDFIFAVYAEELGLFGLIPLLLLYVLIIFRGLWIAMQAADTFERLLAGSISMTFFVYIMVNIGMVSGLLPVVGVPLPLISYGGTFMVTLMAGFGMLMSIHTNRKLLRT